MENKAKKEDNFGDENRYEQESSCSKNSAVNQDIFRINHRAEDEEAENRRRRHDSSEAKSEKGVGIGTDRNDECERHHEKDGCSDSKV